MAGGKLFQTRSPATANALSPSDVVIRGMSASYWWLTVSQDNRGPQDGSHWPDSHPSMASVPITVLSVALGF